MAEKENILAPILKYLVLPVVAIGLVWMLVTNLFKSGGDARKAIVDVIGAIWAEYNREFDIFYADGRTPTPAEQDILQTKLGFLEPPLMALENTVTNWGNVAVELAPIIIAALFVYAALRGHFQLGTNLGKLKDAISSTSGQADPAANNFTITYSTVEEVSMIIRLSTIMELADAGRVAEASVLLTSEQNAYFANILPQMQSSYNAINAMLPTLTGNTLLMAQYLMTQYSYYIQFYSATLPPIWTYLPPLI